MLIIVLLFGLVIGSFLNVLVARFKELETVVNTRSHCLSCKKNIAWYDLAPLLSFILLRGKCRECGVKISWQYPIVEALTAALAIHLYFLYGLSFLFAGYLTIFCLLLVIATIDLKAMVVPDEFILPVILLGLMVTFLNQPIPDSPAWGVLLCGGLLAIFVLFSKEKWMGQGDIGLGVLLGLLAGLTGGAVGLLLAFVTGALVSLGLLLLRKKNLKDMVPFGPFLIGATYVATIWGSEIAAWYLNTVGFL